MKFKNKKEYYDDLNNHYQMGLKLGFQDGYKEGYKQCMVGLPNTLRRNTEILMQIIEKLNQCITIDDEDVLENMLLKQDIITGENGTYRVNRKKLIIRTSPMGYQLIASENIIDDIRKLMEEVKGNAHV